MVAMILIPIQFSMAQWIDDGSGNWLLTNAATRTTHISASGGSHVLIGTNGQWNLTTSSADRLIHAANGYAVTNQGSMNIIARPSSSSTAYGISGAGNLNAAVNGTVAVDGTAGILDGIDVSGSTRNSTSYALMANQELNVALASKAIISSTAYGGRYRLEFPDHYVDEVFVSMVNSLGTSHALYSGGDLRIAGQLSSTILSQARGGTIYAHGYSPRYGGGGYTDNTIADAMAYGLNSKGNLESINGFLSDVEVNAFGGNIDAGTRANGAHASGVATGFSSTYQLIFHEGYAGSILANSEGGEISTQPRGSIAYAISHGMTAGTDLISHGLVSSNITVFAKGGRMHVPDEYGGDVEGYLDDCNVDAISVGLHAGNNLLLYGGYAANIKATAIGGEIDADLPRANDSYGIARRTSATADSRGIVAADRIESGELQGSISVTATGGDNNASSDISHSKANASSIAVESGDNMFIDGDMNAVVSVSATGGNGDSWEARHYNSQSSGAGFVSVGKVDVYGNIGGEISVTAQGGRVQGYLCNGEKMNSEAYGFHATDGLEAYSMAGNLQILAKGGNAICYNIPGTEKWLDAYLSKSTATALGVWSGSDIILHLGISGKMSVVAQAGSITGTIPGNEGTLIADECNLGANAVALYSSNNLVVGGLVDADISVSSRGGNITGLVYRCVPAISEMDADSTGLHANGDLSVDKLEGTVSSFAKGGWVHYANTVEDEDSTAHATAYGLRAGGTLHAGIGTSGTVVAIAEGGNAESSDGWASAVAALGGMDLTVAGTLSATGDTAYAVYAGDRHSTGSAVDRVLLKTGAKINGDIDLTDGDDTLVLEGDGALEHHVLNTETLDVSANADGWSLARDATFSSMVSLQSGLLVLSNGLTCGSLELGIDTILETYANLTVGGNLSEDSDSVLRLQLGNPVPFALTGGSGVINVGGTATLDGILDPFLAAGYSAVSGQTFTVLSAATLIDNGIALNPADQTEWDIYMQGNSLIAQYMVPEPSSVLLLMAGAGGLLFHRRSKRSHMNCLPTRRDFQ